MLQWLSYLLKNFWKVKGTEIEIGSIDVLFKVEDQCYITLLHTCIPFGFLAIIPPKYLCNCLTGFFFFVFFLFFFCFLIIPSFPHVTEDMKYKINLIWTLYFQPGLSWPCWPMRVPQVSPYRSLNPCNMDISFTVYFGYVLAIILSLPITHIFCSLPLTTEFHRTF